MKPISMLSSRPALLIVTGILCMLISIILVPAGTLGRSHAQAPLAVLPPVTLTRLTQAPRTPEEQALPLVLWSELVDKPEPLAIYMLRVDLHSPRLEVTTLLADDPDGIGPAEAALTDPRVLATRAHALVAINANAFAGLLGPDGKVDNNWREGLPVDIIGMAISGGAVRSGIQAGRNNMCFWLDNAGVPHIGPFPDTPMDVRTGVNMWTSDLVAEGRMLPAPGGDRHPRTAIGIDAENRWLIIAVVDGRQPGYSIGMTPYELATLMLRLGCRRAINLDGGGSSILLATGQGNTLEIINRPSSGQPRPVPMMLGVCTRQEK